MQVTPRLSLPYLAPEQAQKHVTVNEALRLVDMAVQLSVVSASLPEEPDAPAEGARYLLPVDASGPAWGAMEEGTIAVWQDGFWFALAPRAGWRCWVEDAGALYVRGADGWSPLAAGGGGGHFDALGVNAEPDATNRLAVKSDAALFSHDDAAPGSGDMRMICNKAAEANTASFLFQRGYAGRAEFGLVGDDDFRLKVSPDGESWIDALVVSRITGRVVFPAGGARERLAAPRTYYVATDGDDENDGLASGTAFATIQRAIDVVYGSLDIGAHDVTIQLADGTYNESVEITSAPVGSGGVVIKGNTGTPGDTIIAAATGVGAINARNGGVVYVEALRVVGGGAGLYAAPGGTIMVLDGVQFGAASTGQMWAAGGVIDANITGASSGSAYAIVDGAARHFRVNNGGYINARGVDVTVSGAPAFSGTAFAHISTNGFLWARDAAYTGAATGKRYQADLNGVIDTNGGGANYFPGDSAGTTATGGQYA